MSHQTPEALKQVLTYHQQTKHNFNAYARSLGYLDWATQPDPFRRYHDAPLIDLQKVLPGERPVYDAAFVEGAIPPAPLNARGVSQLLFDSLAISAWKSAAGTSWALRVNPSSGNLHPTEGYLVCGPVEGLCDRPMVCHYAPKEHALERRAQFSHATWQALTRQLPPGVLLLGFTSVHWREAWKYGERAFRYCQHDVGHAIAAVSIAAAGLGWRATLLDGVGTAELGGLLGLSGYHQAEEEHADCVLAVYSQEHTCTTQTLPAEALLAFADLTWQGQPNQLSPNHFEWPVIDDVAAATTKPPALEGIQVPTFTPTSGPAMAARTQLSLRRIIHQRRSAAAMDGHTGIPRDAFFTILYRVLPGPNQAPLNVLPWRPHVHLALFVHRVEGLTPGLYFLVRDPAQKEPLQTAMQQDFLWERPDGCPDRLPLYLLSKGDVRALARQLSCNQAIASDGCFSLGMVTEFAEPLERFGPWFYPRLFWESGLVGQVLYLEAEAAGVRGTGIGCFFDDPVHRALGLEGLKYQSLYHFTVGGPVGDPRLTTLPAYPSP